MHTKTRRSSVTTRLHALLVLIAALLVSAAQAALVPAAGHTNRFDLQPTPADWSTTSIGGGAGDVTTATALDAEAQGVSAANVTGTLAADGSNPPGADGPARWSSAGLYVQTRPTGVRATLLMCTLVNDLGVDAASTTISYDLARAAAVTEEVDGQRGYYSFTGLPGSWVNIPAFSVAAAGRLTATINTRWTNGTALYLLWADDNGSGTPDTSFQIDNFSVNAVGASGLPVTITTNPVSQTVNELSPVSFSVAVRGYPAATVQWYTNDVAVPGATGTTLSNAATPLSWDGLNFKAVAQNTFSNETYFATSSVATLTVIADTDRPALVSVSSAGVGAVAIAFSEPVLASTATNLANYFITNNAGAVLAITNAQIAPDRTNVTLLTAAQTLGAQYTIVINGVRDVSAAANEILPNTTGSFITADFTQADIGDPGMPGSVVQVEGGYNISGGGSDFGGSSDQFTMAYQQKSGDFDIQVRVAMLGFTDPWAKAALMARASLATNSVFAAAVASPIIAGCYFEARTTTGGGAANTGSFPANYPDTWLRLKRVGNVFTGYASIDGQNWVQLGSATLAVANVSLGFAVTSHNPAQTTTAWFRDYTEVGPGATVVSNVRFSTEPLAAAARTGPMVISEIMSRPAGTNSVYSPGVTNSLEFIELYNSNPFFEDISGYRLSGDIDFTFPPNTVVPGGSFIVVAKDPAALESVYGISGVFGPWSNSLPAKGTIRLRSDVSAILLTVEYSDDNPWPVGADGTGHSLVLARASYGQNDPYSWQPSEWVGGSPGRPEPMQVRTGLRSVVINEVLAHTDPPLSDYIELFNYSTEEVDISGCFLSDAGTTNRFQIPPNTILPPLGFISFDEATLGFALDHEGEKIFFRSANGSNMIDALQFDAQENGVAFGRYPDGSPEFYRLSARTPGTNNAPFLNHDVVINELMYGPISEETGDQYVELYNQGITPVDLSGWRLTSGVTFTFPDNTVLQPDSYLVVAKDRNRLLSKYANLNAGNTVGNFNGRLSRDGERVALAKPEIDVTTNGSGQTITNVLYIVVEEVTYKGGGRWGKWANQGGSSLELIDPRANHRLAQNWADSDETQKAPWTFFEQSGVLDTGQAQDGLINRLEVIMLGEGECLLDEISVRVGTNAASLISNGSFESGLSPWVPQGNHVNSTLEEGGFFSGRALHVRATGNGDTGANRIRSALTSVMSAGQVCTIKGVVRWLRGWPEVTLRIKGGFLEAFGRMELPGDLGTPGARNSRALTNNAPAIARVSHWPVLPQTGDSVVVTAGVQDPDGVGTVTLFWRADSGTPPPFSALAMNDSGTNGDAFAGDGIYSASIPAQSSGTMVAFYVQAADALNATNHFPAGVTVPDVDGQRHDCLVRWNDPIPTSAFATYRLWMSRGNVTVYQNRPGLSNQDVDGTMVVANSRPIYNAKSHYSNSPYHQGQNGDPTSGSQGQHFTMHLPLDDKYLGTENFNKVHAPGNASFEDNNWMREQTAFWIVRQAGLPYLYRRFVAMYVNGNRKAGSNAGPTALMEDTQRPGGELVEEFFPDEAEGRLYKLQPWFEFDDVNVTGGGAAAFSNVRWCTLMPNLSTNAHKIARYRQNYLARSADKTANDYTNVIALINAANVPATNASYWQNFSGLVDIDQWTRLFAVEHAVGNWDSFGNRNSQNMYGYKPNGGKWKLMIWDLNIVVNNAAGAGGVGPGTTSDMPTGTGNPNPNTQLDAVGNLFQTQSDQDQAMRTLNAYPPFRRAWWRVYKELTFPPDAPMRASNLDPIVDAKYAAIRADGLTIPGAADTIKGFIRTARANISNAVYLVDYTGFNVATPTVTASGSNTVTISGLATFDVTDIELNGVSWPITWTTISNWSITLPVTNATQVSVVAFDRKRNVIGGTNSVDINYAAPPPPDPRGAIVFNEVLYNPAPGSGNAEYVELYNLHSNFTFDVSGWRLNGLDYTFPEGSYFRPQTYLVLAKDRVAFNVAYGAGITVFDQYRGTLQGNGETLTLIRPAASSNEVDLVVDKIRYENVAPWSTNADNTGSSLQVVDPNQENARVGNWESRWVAPVYCCGGSTPPMTNDGWRFVSLTGSTGGGAGGSGSNKIMRLLVNLSSVDTNGASAIIDDMQLVAGTNAGAGYNFIRNGDFEATPLLENPAVTNSWHIGTNYTNTAIISDLTHTGNGALKLVCSTFGNSSPRLIAQYLSPAPLSNAIHTLSFWFWASNSAQSVNIRLQNSSGINVTTNLGITTTPPTYTPPQLVTAGTNYATPGVANQFLASLPPFAPLWINEVQAENLTGLTDSYGEREPWIEIYNTSTNTVSLEGLFLSPTYTNLANWAFPPGSSIGPTQFLVVFCDGEELQTSNLEYHASFELAPASGSIALSRLHNGEPQVLDYINYAGLHSDRSYGSFPDGQPFDRMAFFYVTPGGTNDGRSAPLSVFINEWMAANASGLRDPADQDRDDWFEIYNPTTNTVSLAGYFLTDTTTNKTKFEITTAMAHEIPPGGYLLVWADNEPGQNAPEEDLHVNFQLARAGEQIGLYAADGTLIDLVSFSTQLDDVSEGRYPDGSAYITAMPGTASPRAANYINAASNTPPVLNAIGDKAIYIGQTLSFTATAMDSDLPAQVLTFSLDPGAPPGATIGNGSGVFTWTPAAVGSNSVTVRVTDNGVPAANDAETIAIEVLAPPGFASSVRNGDNLELTWGTRAGMKYAIDYTENLAPPVTWTPLGTNTATGNTLSFTNAMTGAAQQFFRVRTVD